MWILFFNAVETNGKCQLYFSPSFSTQVSPEVQLSWEIEQEISDLSWSTPSSSLSVSHSIIAHGLCEDVPIPELSAAAGSPARSMGFVSHQLLLILGVSISSHLRTTFHRRPIMCLNYSHTLGYLWIIFTSKERKKYICLDHCNATVA